MTSDVLLWYDLNQAKEIFSNYFEKQESKDLETKIDEITTEMDEIKALISGAVPGYEQESKDLETKMDEMKIEMKTEMDLMKQTILDEMKALISGADIEDNQ